MKRNERSAQTSKIPLADSQFFSTLGISIYSRLYLFVGILLRIGPPGQRTEKKKPGFCGAFCRRLWTILTMKMKNQNRNFVGNGWLRFWSKSEERERGMRLTINDRIVWLRMWRFLLVEQRERRGIHPYRSSISYPRTQKWNIRQILTARLSKGKKKWKFHTISAYLCFCLFFTARARWDDDDGKYITLCTVVIMMMITPLFARLV